MYEQAAPVRTPQAGSDREQNNRPRAPYPEPPGHRGNTSGHVGCNVEMYEQAAPVRTPQAGSDREQNVGERAPYPDPPDRRGNTSGRGKHASHAYQEDKETSSNVYEEAEAVKLENISGDAAHGTDTSTGRRTTTTVVGGGRSNWEYFDLLDGFLGAAMPPNRCSRRSGSPQRSRSLRVNRNERHMKIGGMSGLEPGTQSSESRTLPLRHTTPHSEAGAGNWETKRSARQMPADVPPREF
ncbi:hypothetical protein Bbelb_416500 [Branchiostoma belcheri]|nr:hypothetical protein Bbelb_416500 [Branchiostoma belcheri]